MTDVDRRAALLTGLLDNELDATELKEANDLLVRDAAFREEYETLRRDLGVLDKLSLQEPGEAELQAFWRLPYSGTARNAGWVLLIGGYLAFTVYGLVQFFADDGEMLFGKLTVAAMVTGGLILFGIVLIERILSHKSDPYKEIEK